MAKSKEIEHAVDPVMGADFEPLASLWQGANPAYPSEQSARWAVKQIQGELAKAGALGLHRGRLFVNRATFAEVARTRALAAASKRYGGAT